MVAWLIERIGTIGGLLVGKGISAGTLAGIVVWGLERGQSPDLWAVVLLVFSAILAAVSLWNWKQR